MYGYELSEEDTTRLLAIADELDKVRDYNNSNELRNIVKTHGPQEECGAELFAGYRCQMKRWHSMHQFTSSDVSVTWNDKDNG